MALETLFSAAEVELRPIRTGLVHLTIPGDRRGADAALQWLEGILQTSPAGANIERESALRR